MKNKKKVLYIVEDDKSAQYRYRVKNVAESLSKSNEWHVDWLKRDEINDESLDRYEFVVILRQTAKDNLLLDTINKVRKSGRKVLFDLDDLIFDYRDLPILMQSTNSKNVFYWTGYFWGIRRIAKKVDGFLCTNEFLAAKLERSFQKPVKVIPNSLNNEQVEVSEKYVKKKSNKGFKIGYFSGSPTHTKDFRLIEEELLRFLTRHKDVVLRIVGDLELSRKTYEMVESKRVEVIEKVNYLELQKLISEVDVNVAPLVVNDFTNCKSELKFFEAAIVETTTIASPSYAFKKAIEDGNNGLLAESGEWYDKLEFLYDHQKENRKIALTAKKHALKNYFGENFLREVEAAYDYFSK